MSLLTEKLIAGNLITSQQLSDARDKQLGAKKSLPDLLIEMGFVKEEDLLGVASEVFRLPVVDLEKEEIDPLAVRIVPFEIAKRYCIFAFRRLADTLILATSDPQDILALEDVGISTKMKIKCVLAVKSQITRSIERHYHADDTVYDIFKNFSGNLDAFLAQGRQSPDEIVYEDKAPEEASPVVRLISLLLSDALKNRASDIHIEPQEKYVLIRYRIDGDLREILKVPVTLALSLANRIKIISGLDIAENRKPQDGRASIVAVNRRVDLRISVIPTHYGEKVELRILDPQEAMVRLDKIGFSSQELELFTGTIHRPQGIILVTGPTGSGKTSTIYAALNSIKDQKKNIMTIEDPIEYLIEGVNQIQVNPVKEVTFAQGLKSILRQDPNVILVGEIRDFETAEIAFRSSLTGHLVFSTLHTSSSVGTITRLLDIGVEPYLMSSSLIFIVAQRLVKCICKDCREEYVPDKKLTDRFRVYIDSLHIDRFSRGKGCRHCDYSGYFGRTAIFELLKISDEIKSIINGKFSEGEILNAGLREGLLLLVEAGIKKVAEGITTLEEVARVAEILEIETAKALPGQTHEHKRILIADDEEDILRVLEKRLKDAGLEVIKARDGEELVERALREKPDLIITDVTMPKMNGFEATKILRSRLETAALPILMLTARQDKESELKGIDIGADDYMTKPFDHEKLLARVKMLLRRGL